VTIDRRPALARHVEFAGMILVLAGLTHTVWNFVLLGYLHPPFVFDVTDTFMDWFNTAYWAHNPGAYSVWRTIYLPLSFIITGLLGDPTCYGNAPFDARDCDKVGIIFLLAAYLACVAVTAIAFWRTDRSTALFRTIAVAAGGPLLFALERGNLIMFAYVAFVLLYAGMIRSKAAVALASGFLINMKVYLLFPVLAFAVKRQWRLLELSGIAAIAIYLLSLAFVGAGTPVELAKNLANWFNYRAGSLWEEVLYSTTYGPYLLFDELQYPVREFVDQQWVDRVKVAIQYEVLASRAIAILCIAGAWFYPKAITLQRLVFFILMQSFIVQNPGGYAMILIVFLVLLERWKNVGTGIAIVCAYLVSIPTDTTVALITQVPRVAWLSGRMVEVDYELPLGALIRPGLLVIMLWSLAIDTLIDLHRAVKADAPNLGLRPREQIPAKPITVVS
jgi:hypothetical protein